MIKNQIQTFHSVFEALTDKGKPSKRMGRKATGLKIAQAIHGGWVAEIGKNDKTYLL